MSPSVPCTDCSALGVRTVLTHEANILTGRSARTPADRISAITARIIFFLPFICMHLDVLPSLSFLPIQPYSRKIPEKPY